MYAGDQGGEAAGRPGGQQGLLSPRQLRGLPCPTPLAPRPCSK